MTQVVSLTGYIPSPRYDSIPWTTATIGESAAAAGPFTLIDTITLTPVDADPTQPRQRSFTTTHATLLSGWYLVTFFDAGGNQEPTTPVPVVQPGASPVDAGDLIVSFTDINPPVRNDNLPWMSVQVSEAAGLAGPWTVIDTLSLIPPDPDPSQPKSRSFTTTNATVEEGFYTLTFLDAAGGSSHPIEQTQDVPSEIRPSLSDLGSFLRARTVVSGTGGTELGTFSSGTRPTDAEARVAIDQATNYVLMEVGAEIPDRMILQAKLLVTMYAAQLIELTFYRNEVNRDQSAYEQYATMYKNGIVALKSSIMDTGPAAPEASFWSVPVLNDRQAHWQHIFAAMDPKTGRIDPSKLPPSEYFPMGVGGIPPGLAGVWPWLYGNSLEADGLAFLED